MSRVKKKTHKALSSSVTLYKLKALPDQPCHISLSHHHSQLSVTPIRETLLFLRQNWQRHKTHSLAYLLKLPEARMLPARIHTLNWRIMYQLHWNRLLCLPSNSRMTLSKLRTLYSDPALFFFLSLLNHHELNFTASTAACFAPTVKVYTVIFVWAYAMFFQPKGRQNGELKRFFFQAWIKNGYVENNCQKRREFCPSNQAAVIN